MRTPITFSFCLFLLLGIASCGPDDATVRSNKLAAYEAAKRFAPKEMLLPDTATFSPYNPDDVARHGDEYTVHGVMEISDDYGRRIRSRYHCTVRQNDVDHRWEEVKTTFDNDL